MTLVPLYDLTQQFNNKNGAILVGGRLYVYYVGRTELATTWADEDAAAQNTNPVLLDNNGRAPVFVDDSYSYTLVVCDRAGTELFSQDITPGGAGSVGGHIVYHDDTLSGAGTVSNLLGVVSMPLGVDETMTAYTGVAEGKDALILGVNGDWFTDTFGSALNDKVDWSSFSSCCSAVKGGLDNKLDASAINNYYTKTEVDNRTSSFVNYNFLSSNYYTKYETSALFQDKLTFDYNENSAISAINGSALAGQGGEESCPWISGAKVIGDTITLTDNTIFQVLSSFDLSGYRNHCIGVKGSNFRFPNRWEIASGIAETNYFMPQSSMSGYLPISSFSSYTASIQNNLNSNWDYTNSAYGLSINNFYNKLDVSAFSSWSATYSGNSEVNNYITNNSSFIDESVNVVQTNSGKWNEIEVYEQNSGTYLTAHQTIPSAKWENASDVVQTNSAQWAENDGDAEVNNVVRSYSANGTWLTGVDLTPYQEKSGMTAYQPVSSMTGYYPMTGNPSGFLTEHQDLSDYATTSIVNNISSYLSGEIDDKLDISSFTAYTANAGETYTLVGGDYISISSDDIEKTTTISYTGPIGDVEVNTTVQNNSATWNNKLDSTAYHELTAGSNIDIQNYVISGKDWTTEIREASANAFNEATAANPTSSTQWNSCYETVNTNSGDWNNVSAKLDTTAFETYTATDETYLLKGGYNIGVSSDDVNKETTIYFTGTNGDVEVNNVVHTNSAAWSNGGDSYNVLTSNSGMWNEVFNLVATYSAKWLINGDV